MITIKLGVLNEAIPAFQKIASLPLPAVTSFQIAKIIKVIGQEVELFNKVRLEIFNKYGKKDEQGNFLLNEDGSVVSEQSEEMINELTDLVNSDIEIPINPIDIEAFSSVELKPLDLLLLAPFIKE